MDLLFNVLLYGVGGFLGFILLLFILALLFGKRIEKQWEFEAEFHNDKGREIAEFDIESSRVAKKEPDFSLKIGFHCRHAALSAGDQIGVFLDELLVVEGKVKKPGLIRLGIDDLVNSPAKPQAGQTCTIKRNGEVLLTQTLRRD